MGSDCCRVERTGGVVQAREWWGGWVGDTLAKPPDRLVGPEGRGGESRRRWAGHPRAAAWR